VSWGDAPSWVRVAASGSRKVKVAPWPAPSLWAWMASVAAGGSAVGLPEALEEGGEEGGIDSLARVGHLQLHVVLHAPQPDRHTASLGGELDGVGEQVPHHLLEPLGISLHGARSGLELELEVDVPGHGRRAHRVQRRLHHGGQLHRLHVQAHPPGDDARDVQQIIDDLRLGPGAALHRLQGPRLLVRGQRGGAQDAGPPEDGRERGAQLVRDGGEELVLGAVGLLGPISLLACQLEETRVLHGDGGPVRQLLDHPEIIRVVGAILVARGQHEDAQRAPVQGDGHRHAPHPHEGAQQLAPRLVRLRGE
jgi:hypothetical protein